MARRRFSQVLTGARGEVAKTKYLDRLRGMGQGERIGTKGNRPDSITLYINPFGLELPPDTFVQASALAPSWTALKGEVASRAKETISATQKVLKLSGFKAARVVRRTKDASGTVTTSKLTGLKYLKYNSTSTSVPFGQTGETDSQGEARVAIKAAIGNGYKVSFLDERT